MKLPSINNLFHITIISYTRLGKKLVFLYIKDFPEHNLQLKDLRKLPATSGRKKVIFHKLS